MKTFDCEVKFFFCILKLRIPIRTKYFPPLTPQLVSITCYDLFILSLGKGEGIRFIKYRKNLKLKLKDIFIFGKSVKYKYKF